MKLPYTSVSAFASDITLHPTTTFWQGVTKKNNKKDSCEINESGVSKGGMQW